MEKIQLDELTYVGIYDKTDFLNEKTLGGLLTSFDRILNSYKDIDLSHELNALKDEPSNSFLNSNEMLSSVIFSKEGCAEAKKKSIACLCLLSHDEKDNWNLKHVYIRNEADNEYLKKLISTSFNFIKEKGCEKIYAEVDSKNKDLNSILREVVEEQSKKGLFSLIDPNEKQTTFTFNFKNFNKDNIVKTEYLEGMAL